MLAQGGAPLPNLCLLIRPSRVRSCQLFIAEAGMSQHKIARVTAHPVAYPEPNDSNATRYLTFVRIESNDGTVGWGEAITQFPASTRATVAIITGWAEDLIGKDPLQNIGIWRDLRRQTWWYAYRGGIAHFALSAIDIALWDLRGKLSGQSLLEMIGKSDAAAQAGVPVLASTHAFDADLEREIDRHARYVHDGYRGVKIGFGKRGDARLGYDTERDIDFVRKLRSAVGPNAWIMIDRGQSLNWTLDETIRRVIAWQEVGLKWIEEPFEPHEFDNFRKLRAQVKCMIAGGEREWDYRGYSEVIDSGTLDVIGCDVGRVEGITGALAIIKLVEAAGVWFNSHAWSSAINTAASIALSASTRHCLVQELKPDKSPMQHELVNNPFIPNKGMIAIPESPGLGIEVNEQALRRYEI
jgi:L-alanine-DL-glutamate epimerase-like enolase superfamily enzyme